MNLLLVFRKILLPTVRCLITEWIDYVFLKKVNVEQHWQNLFFEETPRKE